MIPISYGVAVKKICPFAHIFVDVDGAIYSNLTASSVPLDFDTPTLCKTHSCMAWVHNLDDDSRTTGGCGLIP
jgi:hypothetical protein